MKMRYLLCVVFLSGCTMIKVNVSKKPPHNQLIGTVWKLKTDAYVIQYLDEWIPSYYIVPCVNEELSYLPDPVDLEFNEKNVGIHNNSVKIVGAFKKNSRFRIVKVLKETNLEMGSYYRPVMIFLGEDNKWAKNKKFDAEILYQDYEKKGILNPKYAEKVSPDKN